MLLKNTLNPRYRHTNYRRELNKLIADLHKRPTLNFCVRVLESMPKLEDVPEHYRHHKTVEDRKWGYALTNHWSGGLNLVEIIGTYAPIPLGTNSAGLQFISEIGNKPPNLKDWIRYYELAYNCKNLLDCEDVKLQLTTNLKTFI